MKKTYIQPSATAVALFFADEDMLLALSDDKANGSDALSNEKGGWDCNDWTSVEEED